MIKKNIIILIISIIIVGLAIIFVMINQNKNKFEIIMETNAGIPYEWRYEISNGNVKLEKQYSKSLSKGPTAGGPVEIHYVFKGVKKGTSKITFKFVNFTRDDDSYDKIEVYKVTVDDKLNCTYEKE